MSAATHLFAYGSLMSAELMQAIGGRRVTGEAATLEGFARYRVVGEGYPAVVPERGGAVQGVLYRNLQPIEWRRLDAFEGGLYLRCWVTIRLTQWETLRAQCYLLRPRHRKRLSREGWEFEEFRRHHLAAWLRGG